MLRRPPVAKRTNTRFPDTTLFRSPARRRDRSLAEGLGGSRRLPRDDQLVSRFDDQRAGDGRALCRAAGDAFSETCYPDAGDQIGRAHVRTPVTNAHLVCRLLLEKKNLLQTEKIYA